MSDQIQKLQQLATTELGMTNTKPLIMLPGGGVQISDTAREIYKLAGAQKGLFYSNGKVVKMEQRDQCSLPVLVQLDAATARTAFENYARFGKSADKQGVLSESDAKAILLCDAAREYLPNIRALINRPIPVLHNGVIEILTSGYNANTGLMVAGGTIQEPETLEEAVQMIESVIIDFKFQTDSDKARAIACILTPALKLGGFIKGKTPIDIIEANESQTGKGFFMELRSLVYGEVPILVAQQTGGVGSLDERLGSAFLNGRPFVQIDNFRGELKSASLESYLTNPGIFSIRTPYKGEQYIDGSIHLVSITSNGLTTTDDLARRASFVRLEKEADREFTNVKGKSIDELVKKFQPQYIGAVTKIIRHWVEQGMPRTDEKRHDFREWVQVLDWIVQNVFELPFLIDGNQEAQKRVQNSALGFVRLVAIQIEKSGVLGAEYKAREIADICETGGIEIPGLNKLAAGYTDNQQAQRVGQLLGQAFGDGNEVVVEPYRIIRKKRQSMSYAGNDMIDKRYEFQRLNPGTTAEPGYDI